MTPLTLSSLTAAIAAAGFAMAAVNDDPADYPYGDAPLTSLSYDEAGVHAERVFERSDRDGDRTLNVDEFAALSIVTAELAHLNGFIAIEHEDGVKTIPLSAAGQGALSASEHVRVNAVARHVFYNFAGPDRALDAEEYARLQSAHFKASDLNANGDLNRKELSVYARRQAFVPIGA